MRFSVEVFLLIYHLRNRETRWRNSQDRLLSVYGLVGSYQSRLTIVYELQLGLFCSGSIWPMLAGLYFGQIPSFRSIINLSINQSINASILPSIFPSIFPSIHPSIHPFVRLNSHVPLLIQILIEPKIACHRHRHQRVTPRQTFHKCGITTNDLSRDFLVTPIWHQENIRQDFNWRGCRSYTCSYESWLFITNTCNKLYFH